ncbi:MAG TPA: porin [Longimicrobium sp.]|nr:porin [Longimicrobium sp.]
MKPTGPAAAVALAALLLAAPAAAQFTLETADSARLTIGGRVHTQLNTTSVDSAAATEMLLRRVRLEANLQLNRVVGGRIQPEFAGSRVTLRDAYVRLTLDPAFVLTAGQAHRPASLLTEYSSTRIVPIERGLRIRGVQGDWEQHNLVSLLGYADRDVGLQVRGQPRGAPLGLGYAVGFFNGPVRADFPDENTYQLVARVTARPASLVRVGASWSSRDFARPNALTDQVDLERGTMWEADLDVGEEKAGPRLMAEAVYGDFNPFDGVTFAGVQGWLSYRTGPVSSTIAAVEPLLRVSAGDPDVDDEVLSGAIGGVLVTPGVNLWLGGLNRLQFNYDLWSPGEGKRVHSFKTQFQLAF